MTTDAHGVCGRCQYPCAQPTIRAADRKDGWNNLFFRSLDPNEHSDEKMTPMIARVPQSSWLAKPHLAAQPRRTAATKRNAGVPKAARGPEQGPIGQEIGYMPLANGDSYDGEIAYGRPHGFGTYQSASGDAVVGFFALGRLLVDRSKIIRSDGTAIAATQGRGLKLALEIFQNAEDTAMKNATTGHSDACSGAEARHLVQGDGSGRHLALVRALSRMRAKDIAMMSIVIGGQVMFGGVGFFTGCAAETAIAAAFGASAGAFSEILQKNRDVTSSRRSPPQPRESAFLWSIAGAGLSTMVYYAEAVTVGCAMTGVGMGIATALVHKGIGKLNGDQPGTVARPSTLKTALLVATAAPALLCLELTFPLTVACLVVGAAGELGQQAVRRAGK